MITKIYRIQATNGSVACVPFELDLLIFFKKIKFCQIIPTYFLLANMKRMVNKTEICSVT